MIVDIGDFQYPPMPPMAVPENRQATSLARPIDDFGGTKVGAEDEQAIAA